MCDLYIKEFLCWGAGPLNLTSSARTESSNDLERLQTAHSVRILPYELSTGSGYTSMS